MPALEVPAEGRERPADSLATAVTADERGFEIEPLDDLARADALVARRIDDLGLPTWPVDPPEAHVAVHEDQNEIARVVFVMNPTARDVVARVSLPGVEALVDTAGQERIARAGGAFEVPVPARTIRMMVATG
jgi:hypothetical protein